MDDLETELDFAFLLTDVQYAIAQLLRCKSPGYCSTKGADCVSRALDALERVEASIIGRKGEEDAE